MMLLTEKNLSPFNYNTAHDKITLFSFNIAVADIYSADVIIFNDHRDKFNTQTYILKNKYGNEGIINQLKN